jgi:hypothetical protein
LDALVAMLTAVAAIRMAAKYNLFHK